MHEHQTEPPHSIDWDSKRIVIAGAGALAVANLPGLIRQFQGTHPQAAMKVVLTRQARRFITPTTINLVTDRSYFLDTWSDEDYDEAPHVQMTEWTDAFLVYPATLDFVSRLAGGRGDSPLMLALQCTDAPIGLAPSLPPGGHAGHAYKRSAALLKERPNIVIAEPVVGHSMTTGRPNTGAPAPFAVLVDHVGALLTAGDGPRRRES